jgi:hypothetical protein
MHRQLSELQSQLDAAATRATALVEPLDEATFNRQPSPGGWSVGQCLDHLNISAAAFIPRIDSVLLAGDLSKAGPDVVYKPGIIGGILAWSLEPPYRTRTKTPATFVPAANHDKDTVLAQFVRHQTALRERLDYCDGRDLNKLKIQSPFKESIRYNLYAAFLAIAAHERRHLWQAEQTLDAIARRA